MTELDAARQIVAGTLPSPWKIGGMTLFSIRITGTGLSFRSAHDEFVWRDPSIYLNDEFLARCNGLPVIWLHPEEKPSLDSDEFKKRIIGTVMLPYIRGEEVWAVCRIYVDSAIEMMAKEQWSTSPAVVFRPTDGNQTIELNGETFLIEGNPSLLDHICICGNGVWDVGGPPTGVQNDTLKDNHMDTEAEKKAAEERAEKDRRDAERLDRFDALLTKMDSRFDALEADKARRDAEEDRAKQDAVRLDAARKDRFGSRRDGESYKDWKKRHDEDEAAMMDALTKGGCEADRAKKDAHDCRMDAEEGEAKEGGESFKKWAEEEAEEPGHAADKAKKDAETKAAEEEAKRVEADKARKDARTAESAELRAQIAALTATVKGLTTEVPASERDALAKAQGRADSVAAMFGERAPTPMAGETSLAYRRRLLEKYKSHSQKFKESRFDSADDAILEPVEEIVYSDAVTAAKQPALARPGLLMEIVKPDAAGRQIKTYVGDMMAWMAPYMSQGASGRIRRNPNSNEGI